MSEQQDFKVKELENKIEHGFQLPLEEIEFIISFSNQSHVRAKAFEQFLVRWGFRTY